MSGREPLHYNVAQSHRKRERGGEAESTRQKVTIIKLQMETYMMRCPVRDGSMGKLDAKRNAPRRRGSFGNQSRSIPPRLPRPLRPPPPPRPLLPRPRWFAYSSGSVPGGAVSTTARGSARSSSDRIFLDALR